MKPAYLIVLAIGVTTRLAIGQVSHDAADALRDLAERYRACKAVRVDVSSVYTGGGTTFRSAGRHAVLADGRLASRDWAGFSGPVQGVWETTPTSCKFRLADSLVLPHTARLYMQLGAGDFEDGRLPQDFQAYLQAPWPVLPAWCEALASKDDLVFRHDSGGFSASSEALGLSLRWSREGQLLDVRVGTAGAWSEHEYGNFGGAPFYPPARSVQRIHAGGRERPELAWTYERVEYNPPDAEGAVSPDGLIAKLERSTRPMGMFTGRTVPFDTTSRSS